MLGLLILHVRYWLHVQLIYYKHLAPPNKNPPGRQQVAYHSDRRAVSNAIQRWDFTGDTWHPKSPRARYSRIHQDPQHYCHVLSYQQDQPSTPSAKTHSPYRPNKCTEQKSSEAEQPYGTHRFTATRNSPPTGLYHQSHNVKSGVGPTDTFSNTIIFHTTKSDERTSTVA